MSLATAANLTAQHFRLSGVSWKLYEHLLAELDHQRVRVTYDRGELELMAPSYRHENYGRTIGRLVMVLCEELNLAVKDGGSTTFRSEDLDRGLEPDDCFYIRNVAKVLGKTELDLTVDPPPDLAVEIDIARSSLDRMGIYAALRVPEIWRFDGHDLCVHCLLPNGEYEERKTSPTFPMLPLTRVAEFVKQSPDLDDVTLVRRFRAWVRRQLLSQRKRRHKSK